MNRNGFNCRSGHPVKYESLWSAIHKFMLVNSVGPTTYLRFFGRKRGGRGAYLPAWLREGRRGYNYDLRVLGKISGRPFARACGASEHWLRASVVDSYSSIFDWRHASLPFLRFCPMCIERGFHATIFQLADIHHCPIHGELLRDSCPKCGDWLPLGFPEPRVPPYACSKCKYQLWLDAATDNWPPPFASPADMEEFGLYASSRLILPSKEEVLRGPRIGVHWSREKTNQLVGRRRDEVLAKVFGQAQSGLTSYSWIRRGWGRDFSSSRWSLRPSDPAYGAFPAKSDDIQEALYLIYRAVERRIFKGFPTRERKRSLNDALRTIGFQRLRHIKLKPEFLGYLVWRAYWEERPSTLTMRRKWGANFRGSYYQKKLKRSICLRYRQHARVLGMRGCFTSADVWAHHHYFALALFATYNRSVEFVKSPTCSADVLRIHHAAHVSEAKPPFALLVRLSGCGKQFEFRIYC